MNRFRKKHRMVVHSEGSAEEPDDAFQPEEEPNPEDFELEEESHQFKRVSKGASKPKAKPKKLTKNGSKTGTKSKSNMTSKEELNDDSQGSQILQIRHGDEMARQHVRPSFLRRWDGVSNELELTFQEINQMSPMFQVYWRTKSRNMNSVVLLEFGKMEYFSFQDDAIKLSEMFKKKLKKYSKFLLCNFWCKEVETVKKELFERKIPVLVMNEFDDQQYRAKHGIMRRQIREVLTPALHINIEDKTPRSRLLLSLFRSGTSFAFLLLDGQTNHLYLQECTDDQHMHQIRRVLNCYRPVQVVLPDRGHKDIAQMARQICSPHLIQLSLPEFNPEKILDKYCDVNMSLVFRDLRQKFEDEKGTKQGNEFSQLRSLCALELLRKYLDTLSLVQKIFEQGLFFWLQDRSISFVPFFDSQVYENLELFRIRMQQEQTYAKPGTLMGYLNHCKTLQGRNLLHKWIDQPLTNQEAILDRQQAVQQMVEINPVILKMHDKLLAYEKLEKRLGDIYHWVVRGSERGKLIETKNINYDKQYDVRKNPAVIKLKQMINVLSLIEEYQVLLQEIRQLKIKSPLLNKLTQLKSIDNIHQMRLEQISQLRAIPQIGHVAGSIKRRCTFDPVTGHLEPTEGESQIFDDEKKQLERLNYSLQEELDKWKEYFKTQKLCYVSVRAKNEIQVPKQAINRAKPHSDLIFSSEIAGSIRYTTPATYAISQELKQHQQLIAQSYQPFLQDIVNHFCKFRFLWDMYSQSIAQLDVLMALATAAKTMGRICLPKFGEGLTIRKGFHVNLLPVLEAVVPNTVQMRPEERVLLLTGPNMGGKSTFLKQVCVMAVLAQIGSYVPAEYYCAPVFDQIFCRMGASDRIYEGQSTFYVQLQETQRITSKATARSLIVIDELGRGTSTFDGMAIAQAVLDHLTDQIKALTLYSTHYTQITEQFHEHPHIRMMKMGYNIENEDIEFTYQLVPGVAEKSFAGNVGKMVKINPDILRLADKMSQELHRETKMKKLLRDACTLASNIPATSRPERPKKRKTRAQK